MYATKEFLALQFKRETFLQKRHFDLLTSHHTPVQYDYELEPKVRLEKINLRKALEHAKES